MDDDLNTPKALASVFDLCREINRGRDNQMNVSGAVETVRRLTGVLGLSLGTPPKKVGDNMGWKLPQQRCEIMFVFLGGERRQFPMGQLSPTPPRCHRSVTLGWSRPTGKAQKLKAPNANPIF